MLLDTIEANKLWDINLTFSLIYLLKGSGYYNFSCVWIGAFNANYRTRNKPVGDDRVLRIYYFPFILFLRLLLSERVQEN